MTLQANPNGQCTLARLRELLTYDAETGDFAPGPGRSKYARFTRGVGCISSVGYRVISLDGRQYQASRLAWLYVYGVWPQGCIDHIDHDTLNNRIANLRDVSASVNAQNQVHAHSRSKSGLLGVIHRGSKWGAKIHVDGKDVWLGLHDSPSAAHAAYCAAKQAIHPGGTL